MFNGEEFGKQIVAATKSHIDKTVAPLLAQIEALKAEIGALKQRPVAKEVKPEDVAAIIADNVRKDVEALRSAVEAIPAPLPAPKLPDIPAMISEALAVSEGRVLMQANEMIDKRVALEVAALPEPPSGKDGDPGAKGDIGPAGQAGINGKDGIGLAGAMIDRKGVLILTLSDGTTRELGHVVGKDVDMNIVEGMIDKATHKALAEAWAAVPEPKDGERGPQGEPGKSVTLEDIAPLIDTAVAELAHGFKELVPDLVKTAVSSIKVPEAPQLPDIPALVEAAVKALPPAQDGKDADPEIVASLVAETVERAVAALPVPKDGASVTLDDVRPLIEAEVTKAVTLIPAPKDGKDADPAEVARMLAEKANDNNSMSDGEFSSRVSICLGKAVQIKA